MSKVVATKRILVIGNGGSGSKLTAELAKIKGYAVTVVTPFDYQEVTICMTKAIAAGSEAHGKALFPLTREDNVEYIIEPCVSLTNTVATMVSGRTVEFDVCIVATGQQIPIFNPDEKDSTREARIATIAAVHQQVRDAQSIVISGGGPVGAELAADIKLRFKEKKVTLVHPKELVLAMMNAPFPVLH